MKSAKLTHIEFYTSNVSKTVHFWENILGLKNRFKRGDRLNYTINELMIIFQYSEKGLKDFSQAVGHLGIEFSSKAEVDAQYKRLQKNSERNIPKPFGGLKQGPYRFYLKDPNGISIEFGTWEGCSD